MQTSKSKSIYSFYRGFQILCSKTLLDVEPSSIALVSISQGCCIFRFFSSYETETCNKKQDEHEQRIPELQEELKNVQGKHKDLLHEFQKYQSDVSFELLNVHNAVFFKALSVTSL